jgi:hypothetical protein
VLELGDGEKSAWQLYRNYGAGYLHFITTSCDRRNALLDTPQSRDLFLECIGTQWCAVWCWSRNSGTGAATVTTL